MIGVGGKQTGPYPWIPRYWADRIVLTKRYSDSASWTQGQMSGSDKNCSKNMVKGKWTLSVVNPRCAGKPAQNWATEESSLSRGKTGTRSGRNAATHFQQAASWFCRWPRLKLKINLETSRFLPLLPLKECTPSMHILPLPRLPAGLFFPNRW